MHTNANKDTNMHKDFENERVLITGASRGLGRALAFELGRRGAHIAIVARDKASLNTTQQELRQAGISVLAIAADLGNLDDADAIAAQVHEELGGVDLLIHNASSLGPVPMLPLAEIDSEEFAHVLRVGLLGPHRLTQALGGNMLLHGGGTIVTISSDAAISPYPNWGAYSAAKIALDHMSRIWAAETADSGLRFLLIDPGEMATQMHADALPDADPSTLMRPGEVARRIAAALVGPPAASGSRIAVQQGESSQ